MCCILPQFLTDNDNALSGTQAGAPVSLNTACAFRSHFTDGSTEAWPRSDQVLKVTSRRSWENRVPPDQGSQEATNTYWQDPLRRFQANETLPLENLGALYLAD